MNQVMMVNAKDADAQLIHQMFEGYDSAIRLENDKDTKTEFLEILSSADEQAQFYFTYIEDDRRAVSGTVSVRLWVNGQVYHGIVYAFTDKEYRKRGLGRRVIEFLISNYRDEFWFCEVLDQEGLSEEELAAEEEFSGVACAQRDQFWHKMGFRKGNFDYANPGLENAKGSGGVITYNNLWIRAEKNAVKGDELLAVIRAYFLAEYCAGQADAHLDGAYDYMEKQIAGKMIALVTPR
jgi:GNAT superfamily N-acetyltransferase